jgi:hypothetical protein
MLKTGDCAPPPLAASCAALRTCAHSRQEACVKPILTAILCLACTALPCAPVAAADAPRAASTAAPKAAALDEEEALDESLKSFGYLSGLARGCVVPAQRGKLEREVLDLAAVIARLFGTDRSFLYASGFGYGTSIQISTAECSEVLQQYDARVAKFRAQRGEKP